MADYLAIAIGLSSLRLHNINVGGAPGGPVHISAQSDEPMLGIRRRAVATAIATAGLSDEQKAAGEVALVDVEINYSEDAKSLAGTAMEPA